MLYILYFINTYHKIYLDPGADPANEDTSPLYRFNFSDQLINGEDMRILLIPSLNDEITRVRPPFGDLFIFYTVDVSLMPYIGFYHMARIILDETTVTYKLYSIYICM